MTSENAERYRIVALGFTRRVEAVQDDAWPSPAPCDGWVALDVVRHLVDWVPPFVRDGTGLTLPAGPPVDSEPAGAWLTMTAGIQSLLDRPDEAGRMFDHPIVGRRLFDDAIMEFVLPDVLIHTWDLARATGLDERLDPDEVHRQIVGIESMPSEVDEAMRSSGHFGPRVAVADDADEQTRLLAYMGRKI